MATESTGEHGNIKNFHVGCAVHTGDNAIHRRDAKNAEKLTDFEDP
jgi:hypothetical protein